MPDESRTPPPEIYPAALDAAADLLHGAGVGLWALDVADNRVRCSRATCTILGLQEPFDGTLEALLACVHPDDRDQILRGVALALTPGGPGTLLVESRVEHGDGREAWVEWRGRVRHDADHDRPVVVGVTIDMTHRKTAEERLRHADTRKNEFIAMVAHELRTPLAPIETALQLLIIGDRTGSLADRLFATIQRQVRQLARLTEDLLDLSRAARGVFELRRTEASLEAVIGAAVETALPYVESGRHELTVSCSQHLRVTVDGARLTQVIANLLVNAARYTPAGGRIWVNLTREGEHAIIRVGDTGRGIPREMLGRIFDLYAQVDRPLAHRQAGLGIGLALAKRVVELHGGTIEARSEGMNHGSEFIIRLPLNA